MNPNVREFAVELPVFTGPFRLLADLVLDQKVDICDVPLSHVTEEFVRRGTSEVHTWPLDEATWFVSACAILIELKVGRLLPRNRPETEDDLLDGVSPDLLYARSLELAAFRRLADVFADRIAAASLLVGRDVGPPPELAHLYPDPMEHVRAEDLGKLAAELLAPPPALDLSHVTPIRATLAEALATVERRLAEARSARFRDLLDDEPERIEVVVRFLAILELYRVGRVDLKQAGPLGDIEIRWDAAPPAAPDVDAFEIVPERDTRSTSRA